MQVGDGKYKAMSEINVTPFVDVMLVLLVIFMVTAPLIHQGMDVDLPKASTANLDYEEDELVVTLNKEGNIYIQDVKYTVTEFKDKIAHIYKAKERKRVFLGADKGIAYGQVIDIMASLKNAGFTEVGLITEPQELVRKK